MVRLISRQLGDLAALKLTKLSWIDDFPAAKDSGEVLIIIAPAGFWPRCQNPRRHPRVPRVYVYTYKRNIKKVLKKCVGSMGIFSI